MPLAEENLWIVIFLFTAVLAALLLCKMCDQQDNFIQHFMLQKM